MRDVSGAQLPDAGDIGELEEVRTARGLRAKRVRIVSRGQQGNRTDDRETCRHCGKKMVLRLIVASGQLQRSVCPFCGETYRQFALPWVAIVILSVVLFVFLRTFP